jgi:hypothetical protein
MKEETCRTISAYCSIASTVVALLGAIIVVLQIRSFIDAKETENRKKQEELVSKLYWTDIDLNKILIQDPALQPVIYHDPDGKAFGNLSELDKSKCYALSQMFGDLLEYYTMLEDSLNSSDRRGQQMASCWEQYITYLWENSFVFRKHILFTKDTWTEAFRKKFPKAEFRKLETELSKSRPVTNHEDHQ